MLNRQSIETAVKFLARNGSIKGSFPVTDAPTILTLLARTGGHAKGYGWTREQQLWRNAASLYSSGDITLAGLRGWMGAR